MDDTPHRLIRDDEANVYNMSNLISSKYTVVWRHSVNMTYDTLTNERSPLGAIDYRGTVSLVGSMRIVDQEYNNHAAEVNVLIPWQVLNDRDWALSVVAIYKHLETWPYFDMQSEPQKLTWELSVTEICLQRRSCFVVDDCLSYSESL